MTTGNMGARTPLPPMPSTVDLVLRAFYYQLRQFRRTWRGTSISAVVEPIGFLGAMGLGLGTLVNQGPGADGLGGVDYLLFLAPGLLAATTMQMAAFESTYPVMGAIKWHRTYHAMLATPLRTRDLLAGHLLFIAMRLAISAGVFLVIMAAFGAIDWSWTAPLCLLTAVLTGMAFAPAIFAFAATRENDSGFAMLFRFGIMPMFLFSGTFFPISQLPDAIEPVAWLVPLWHGVALTRDLALGTASLGPSLVHVGFLVACVVVGFAIADRTFRKVLVT